jgi:hypothetical protein
MAFGVVMTRFELVGKQYTFLVVFIPIRTLFKQVKPNSGVIHGQSRTYDVRDVLFVLSNRTASLCVYPKRLE